MTNYNDDGIRALAVAVAQSAIYEYRHHANQAITRHIRNGITDPEELFDATLGSMLDATRWMRSGWFEMLTGIDGAAAAKAFEDYVRGKIREKLKQ